MRRAPLPLLALLFAPAVVGQERQTVDPVPFEWATTSAETGFPFGYPSRDRLRYLQVHDGMRGRAQLITALAFRRAPADDAPVPAFRADVELRLSTARTTAATIAASFAANHGTDRSVVTAQRSIDLPASPGHTDPGPAPFEYVIPTDTPWPFAGSGPLCLDLRVTGHGNPVDTRFALVAEGRAHRASFGIACGGTTSSVRFEGTEAVHEFTGLPPTAPFLALVGNRFDDFGGGNPLPADLTPLGADGCSLYLDPLTDVRGLSDAGGAFALRIPVDSLPAGFHYGLQGVAVQPGVNALGVVTTDAAVVVPRTGRDVGRVWVEDPDGATGQRQPVYGLVVEVRR